MSECDVMNILVKEGNYITISNFSVQVFLIDVCTMHKLNYMEGAKTP